MAKAIHITTARTMLNSGDPVDISVWKANGEILHLHNCISLRYDFYAVLAILNCSHRGKSAKSEIAASSRSMTLKYSF